MNLIDKINLPTVCEFIEAKMSEFDTSRLDWLKLLPLTGRRRRHGMCTYPKRTAPRKRSFVHQYRIRCSINTTLGWPVVEDVATDTWRHETNWGYEYSPVVYYTLEEMAAFLAGHEAFHFLRHSRQIEGRNTEPQANRYGITWLREYRNEQG